MPLNRPGDLGHAPPAAPAFAAVSSSTTIWRIAGAQPMSTVWPGLNDGVADGTGVWLGWPDGVDPVSGAPVGVGVVSGDAVGVGVADGVAAGGVVGPSVGVAVGVTVGLAVAAGLDGAVGRGAGVCEAGVWAGVALWVGVLVGAGVLACGDFAVRGVDPPPLSGVATGPAVGTAPAGTVAKSPCS